MSGGAGGRGGRRAGGESARRGEAAAFCSALWTDAIEPTQDDQSSGLFVTVFVTEPQGERCEWIPVEQSAAIVDEIVDEDVATSRTGGNVYIGATLSGPRGRNPRDESKPQGRPSAIDARALTGVWIDFDIAGLGGHSDKHTYPQDEQDVRAILRRLPIPPTAVVHSGHGWQAWWLLAEPWVFGDLDEPDEDRRTAADLARDWCHTVRAHAEDAGDFYVDSAFDLARLMRPAGTTNRKGAPVAVRMLDAEHVGLPLGTRYDLDDLYAGLADDQILKAFRTPRPGPDELGGVDLHRIWARVVSAASRERRYTPPWVAAMNDAVDTTVLATAWEDGYERDDPSTVDARLARFLFDHGCSTEQVCEAIMALHLRTGHKIDKVDPNRRADYMIRTVATFRATSRAAAEAKAQRDDLITRAAEHAAGARTGSGTTVESLAPDPPTERDASVRAEVGMRREAATPPASASVETAGEPADAPGDDPAPLEDGEPEGGENGEDGEDGEDGGHPETGGERAATVSAPERAIEAPGSSPDPLPDRAQTVPTVEVAHEFDALAQHIGDRIRHPVDEVGDGGIGDGELATPPPSGRPNIADPFGKRDQEEAQLFDLLTELLIAHQYVSNGVQIWRIEYRNYGPKQEGRLILRLPSTFTWPTGDRPGLYKPGRPFAMAWRPRVEFATHKGFHASVTQDARIMVREVAPKGNVPEPHQADQSSWRAMITALTPYWRRDSSGTDLATAAHEWLRTLLSERPAVQSADEAASSGRPWLADPSGYRADPPPRIYIDRTTLLDYLAAQPGSLGAGPGSATVLDFLSLHDRRVRGMGAAARRRRWLEIGADEFDAEEWAGIVDDTAAAILVRERNAEARRGLRVVASDETRRSATEVMQARLSGDDAASEATAVGEHGPLLGDDDYQGETF